MNLSHAAYYRLTPREFRERLAGWEFRENRIEEREANWVANLMNASGNMKEKMSAEKVLGRPIGPLRHDPEKG